MMDIIKTIQIVDSNKIEISKDDSRNKPRYDVWLIQGESEPTEFYIPYDNIDNIIVALDKAKRYIKNQ